MSVLDAELEKYATPEQWQKLKAYYEHGSDRKAAAALGCNKGSIHKARKAVSARAAKHGYSPDHDLTHPLPDGFRLRGASTLYDMRTGEAKVQWIKSEADRERQLELFREAIEAMADDLPRIKPTSPPHDTSGDLLACYPVGDHHLGMLSWEAETGDDYDLKIGENLLSDASHYLINASPKCDRSVIAFLGDFMHYDSFETVTPTNRNTLDSDTRFPKLVRAAIRSMRRMIEYALTRHSHVHVIVEIGNHDLASSIFLMECLQNIYENEPRITVDTSPKHFHYLDFGKCLIGVHHGHGVKMEQLPLIMATDQPELWGASQYRYWWTGHIHRDTAKDFAGCKVESFSVLCPADAWAHQSGYRPTRTMKSIILHKEFGEVARHTVNPGMFDG